MDFSYYPGCSLHSTASEYNASVQAVFLCIRRGAARAGRLELLRSFFSPQPEPGSIAGFAGAQPGHRAKSRHGRGHALRSLLQPP